MMKMRCRKVESAWNTQGYYGHFDYHYDVVLIEKDEEKA